MDVLAALATLVGAALALLALWMLVVAARLRDERATGCAIAAALLGLFWVAVGYLLLPR